MVMLAATALAVPSCRWVEGESQQAVSSLELSPQRRTIGVLGANVQLRSRARSPDGAVVREAPVIWSSSAPGVATVDSMGRVTGVRPGSADVTATIGSVSDTAAITVDDVARLVWKFSTGGRITGSVSLSRDGSILVGSLGPSRILHAVHPDGHATWDLPLMTYGAPAIAVDDVIYVATADGNLVAVNPRGAPIWRRKLGSKMSASPVSGGEGVIYVTTVDGVLHALDASGGERWRFRSQGEFGLSTPAVGAGGRVYVGSLDGHLYALHPDGSLAWRFQTGGAVQASPVIGSDSTIYVGSSDTRFYAIRPDGTERWHFSADREIWAAAALDTSGRILVGSVDGRLYALGRNGELLWSFATDGPIVSGPIIGTDGTSYVGDVDGRLYAVSHDGDLRWDFPTGGLIQATPAIGPDGTIYVASYDGYVYSLSDRGHTDNVDAPWPTFGRNRGNRGWLAP